MEKHQGIVLKTHFPHLYKCVIFDKIIGKLEGTTPKRLETVAPGFLIAYYPIAQGNLYRLDSIELMQVPTGMSCQTITFLHHVLELCYYFLPYESVNENIFSLIEFLLHAADLITYSWFKKIFLLRFFINVGLYPEDEMLQTERIQELINPTNGLNQPFPLTFLASDRTRVEKVIANNKHMFVESDLAENQFAGTAESIFSEDIKELLTIYGHLLDSHTNQALTKWLQDCIAMHPQRHLFKTLAIGSEYELWE